MKKIVWFVFLCCIMVGQPVWAQNRVTEQQKVEYDKGNRDQKFLKEYIEALKADGQTEILNGVVDEYLMVLPLNERYSGGNLSDFVEYITHMNTKTIVDIIENWDKLSFTEEQADKIVEKIDHVCKMDLFQVIMKEREDGKGPIMDCSSLQTALRKSGIPVSNVRRQTIEMWQYWQVKDITGMIGAFENMFVESEASPKEKAGNGVLDLETMFDGVILGSMVNYILEESNLEQCTKILDIMNLVVEKNDNSTFVDMIAKWKDNFEGKKMLIEMGEE